MTRTAKFLHKGPVQYQRCTKAALQPMFNALGTHVRQMQPTFERVTDVPFHD